jgi:hypothetical protein
MTVEWKARKTKNRFPSPSTALGNRCRDSHIPTAPTRWSPSLKNQTRKEFSATVQPSSVQAHFSMRICSSRRADAAKRELTGGFGAYVNVPDFKTLRGIG